MTKPLTSPLSLIGKDKIPHGSLLAATLQFASRILIFAALALLVFSSAWIFSTRRYLKGFSDAIVPLVGSPEEKTEALAAWFRNEPGRSDPASLESSGLLINRDPVYIVKDMRLLKICGSASNAFMNLADAAGLKVRRLLLLDSSGGTMHVVVEVQWGGRWVVVTPQQGFILKDQAGRALTKDELRDPAVFQDAISRIPGYSPRYTFAHTAHIRLERIPYLGGFLRRQLDRSAPGWEEKINWAYFPENPPFWFLFASVVLLLLGLMVNIMVSLPSRGR
jgi:hypothetical protein